MADFLLFFWDQLLTLFYQCCTIKSSHYDQCEFLFGFLCSMQLKEAVEKYLNTCRAENISENTIKDKSRHLGWFCDQIKKETEDIELDDIYEFINQLDTTDIRKWRVKIDLRAFFKFLNERHLSSLTYTLIKNKEPELGIRPHLTEKEFKQMDEVCHELIKGDRRYTRWHAIHHFLYETGLRKSECCNIPLNTFSNENKTFIVTTAKTHKKRQGFFQTTLCKYLEKYKPKKFLFEINKRQLGQIIETLVKKAGITRKITPHSYRHAYCTRLLTSGCPIQQTALLAGHQKISTTMRY